MTKRNFRKGMLDFPFVAIPTAIMRGEEWARLPPAACKLALDLAAQYTGRNNGRLTPSFEAMSRVGWVSRTTLIKAKVALLKTSFIVLTRKGHPPRTPEWVGVTWFDLDYDKSMDVSAKGWPKGNFKPWPSMARIDPNKRGEPPLKKRVVMSRNWTDRPSKGPLRGPETGPIDPPVDAQSIQKMDHATEVRAEKVIGPETGHVLDIAIYGGASEAPATPATRQRPERNHRKAPDTWTARS